MAAARTPSATRQAPPSRGRIDKRAAILDAAFTVFARQGYAQACVKEIAQEAGVAKPTVYNHLNDKATLFRETMAAAAERILAEYLAAVEALAAPPGDGADLRPVLEKAGRRVLRIHCDERARALRRLTLAEAGWCPELRDAVSAQAAERLTEAVADRFARLSLAGRLRTLDPVVAAEQFLALLTGPADTRTRMGARTVPGSDLDAVASAAADTFLRAFGPER